MYDISKEETARVLVTVLKEQELNVNFNERMETI